MTAAADVAAWVQELLGVQATEARSLAGGHIGEAWRVDTAHGGVFAKTKADAPPGFFPTEAAGLEWLREPGVLSVPEVLGVDERILILAFIEAGRPTVDAAVRLGAGLARLHNTGATDFGAVPPGGGTAGFLGRLGVTDVPCARWSEFFVDHRLEPLAAEADRRGALPAGTPQLIDRIGERLLNPADDLAGPEVPPARLHGDLWAGNVVWGADGNAWLIDPAARGGHPEADLAMMALFGGFTRETFAAYDEVNPPLPGRDDRVALHQLAPLLVHACLFGGSYGAQVDRVARRYT